MKFLSAPKILAATTLAFASLQLITAEDAASEPTGPSDVLDLTKDTFAKTVDPEPLILVEFFAPWCGHCQALKSHYEAAATELKSENIKLAKVDCTVEEDLCSEQDVRGYPTLKVFRNGVAKEYGGPRKTEGIISYMKKQALPAVSTVTADDLTQFKSKDKVVIVSFLADSDKKDLDAFSKVAEQHRDSFLFGHASAADAAKAAGVDAPAVIVYRSFDEPEVKYTGKISDSDALEKFIKQESVPLIDEVGPDNFMTYAEAGLPLAYYFTDPEYKEKDADIEKIRSIAKANRGKLNFVWIDAIKFVNHAKGLNLDGEHWPAFAIQDLSASTKYPLQDLGKDVEKTVGDFVSQFTKGSLKPSIKSEPIPTDQDGPVFTLVADEFDKVVLDDKKDIFVEFYAPWCGHCKKLAPVWDSLGEAFSSHKDKVVIAKMDATANDIPPSGGFSVGSFPTIKFKKAGSKEFIDYEGERTLDAFVEFVAENSKHKVKVELPPVNETTEETEKKEEHHAPKHEEL